MRSIAIGVLITVLGGTVLAPAQTALSSASPQAVPFVIDREKPFAYVEFIRTASRKPVVPGEPDAGVWLRFVNNCRVPIGIKAIGTGDELRVAHEVVYVEEIGFVAYRNGKRVSPEKTPRSEMPKGYALHGASWTFIPPGGDVQFSIPVNHVSDDWFVLFPFEFMLDGSPTYLRQPSMEVSFSIYDIPNKERSKFEIRRR